MLANCYFLIRISYPLRLTISAPLQKNFYFSEKLVFQMFNDTVKPKLNSGKSPLDPLLLWPIGPEVIKKTLFKGKFRCCNMYLYNMKSINLTVFEGNCLTAKSSLVLSLFTFCSLPHYMRLDSEKH